jgi:signal transduction histidine kinase
MTLRRRLALLYMAATAAFFLLSALTAVFFFNRGLESLADRKLRSTADEAADILAAPGPFSLGRVRPRLDRFSESLDGFFVSLRGPGGELLYGSDPGLAALRPPAGAAVYTRKRISLETVRLPAGGKLRTASVFLPGVAGGLLLELGLPLPSPLRALSAGSWSLLGGTALLFFLAAGWAGWAIAGRALSPIDRIVEVAVKAGEGDLSGRIPRHRAEDELGALVDVLNGMLAAIEAYSIKMKQFASNVSHQLKTPITVMRGETEVALLGKPGRAEAVAVLESNLAELETMTRVIEDILEYSRLDGRGAGRPKEERLDALAARIAKKAAVLALPRSQKVETELEAVSALVQAGKLEQALLNIVDNAVRNTPAGGRIILRTSGSGGRACVSVEDTGPGVRPENLPRLFERGYSTSGSGLGLGLARAMVESFSGKIEVSSPPGAGLTVRILLPAVPVQNLPSRPTE